MSVDQVEDCFVVTGMTPVRVAGQEFPNGASIPGNLLRSEWGDRQLELIIRAGIVTHEAEVRSRIDPAWVVDPRFPTSSAPDSSHSMTRWVSQIGSELAEPLPPKPEPKVEMHGNPAPDATPLPLPATPAQAEPLPVAVPALLDEMEDYGDGPGAEMVDVELPPLPGEELAPAPVDPGAFEDATPDLVDTLAVLAEVKAKVWIARHPEVPVEDLVLAEAAGRNRRRLITWIEGPR